MISTIARTDKSTLQHDEGLTQCQFNEAKTAYRRKIKLGREWGPASKGSLKGHSWVEEAPIQMRPKPTYLTVQKRKGGRTAFASAVSGRVETGLLWRVIRGGSLTKCVWWTAAAGLDPVVAVLCVGYISSMGIGRDVSARPFGARRARGPGR
ncbi:hypothetical protein An04g04930 [Aspergillus niger]|uniref:Uncharacterized protein n=2 Tax=Aspergillus niger TaxID=5061 RepID=A2QIW1_ASPNC|nr:hypothetical protein An04g04930 [Aspergillus niger]CAK38755.1 hypothetical protein An04g04930 [Aspergillus niger]